MLNKTKKLLKHFSTVQLSDLQTNPLTDFVVTKDLFRADLALLISRRPIFWDLGDEEIDHLKATHKLRSKYDLYSPVFEEFVDFNKKELFGYNESRDEIVTHRKKTEKGLKEYRQNSKLFQYVDPSVVDNRSIQHASSSEVYLFVKIDGKWQIPYIPLDNSSSFELIKDVFFKSFADKWTISFTKNYPVAVKRDFISEREKTENEFYGKCKGRKLYLFPAHHDEGTIKFKEGCFNGRFEDFAWVSKPELSKFVDKKDFEFYSRFLKPF